MRSVFAEQPTLLDRLADPLPALLLAPHVTPPLTTSAADGLDLILEGFLLHHGTPRLLPSTEPGRRVLAGDFCYAQGLVRVAADGDLRVVEALAELIALSAAVVADGDGALLPALWTVTVAAIRDERDAFRADVSIALDALRAGDAADLDRLAARVDDVPGLAAALRA
ncbi:MAG: hypothetical protein HYX33_01695 [Actinobacteria bacterium]|nr:hypothetical protein [Actinomycetota bacterium]